MNAVAIVSIGVSGIVAVAAILVGVWQQRRGFQHDRNLADRASVQGILSDAASVLHHAEYAIDGASLRFTEWGAKMWENDERAAPYATLREVGTDFDAVLGQVRIRIGPEHPATLALGQANAAYLDAYRALDLIRMEDPAISGTYAEKELAEFIKRERQRLAIGRDNFKIAAERFVTLAHAAAGAELYPQSTNDFWASDLAVAEPRR